MLQLPEHVKYIIARLEQAGFEAYAVGGCVRDGLLGRTPEDWDITTSARPQEVKALFKRTIDTGIQHGTVTVLMPVPRGRKADPTSGNAADRTELRRTEEASSAQPVIQKQPSDHGHARWEGYEVTTYRIDGAYLDSRHPSEVIFTPSLHEDLARRDFTINAMAVNERSGIVDDFGGLQDLQARRIRAVGDPEKRFTEDALRMLRALRFSAQLGFDIDPATWEAVGRLAPRLAKVSKERIQVELTKLMLSEHPERIRLVFASGLAAYVSDHFRLALPEEAVQPAWMPACLPHVKYVRWGVFLRAVPAEARCILRELKMDNETIAQAAAVAGLLSEALPDTRYQIRKQLSVHGFALYESFLAAALCLAEAEDRCAGNACTEAAAPSGTTAGAAEPKQRLLQLRQLQAEVQAIRAAGDCIGLKDLRISGQDLLQLGIPKGPALGSILHLLLEQVLEEPSRNTREFLLESAREHAAMP